MFTEFLTRWRLSPAGDPVKTHASALLPVTWRGLPAMLKVARCDEEARGASLMEWWAGEGAAKVYARDGAALLMERATGAGSLARLSTDGQDEKATRIICSAVQRLHAPRFNPPADLVPLGRRFNALESAGRDGVVAKCAAIARCLLAAPVDVTPLHGDIHHGNILDFGERGWLAIDPKGLLGDRAFDFANLFCNPDEMAALPDRFDHRLAIVSAAAGIERTRLLRWIAAWCGLSAAFHIEDGEAPEGALEIARLALARLA